MKRNYFIAASFMVASLLSSCSNDSLETTNNLETKVSVSKSNKSGRQAWGYFEGQFVKVNANGTVYFLWGYNHTLRHIDSQATWDGLFTGKSFTYTVNSFAEASALTNYPIGQPLFADNGLLHHVPTGKIYFREGNKITYITSEAAFNKYHFSWAAIQNVNSLEGYVAGDNPLE